MQPRNHHIRYVPEWRLPFTIVAILFTIAIVAAAPARAQTASDSTVTLLWTAPGDDGTTGTAASYDLRYRTAAVTGVDTLTWWNAATRVTSIGTPRPAGSTDSVVVRGLTPSTTYYFILRSADEVPNWSGFSNVAIRATAGDVTPPSSVTDLAVTGSTGTTIGVRWTAPGDDGTTGTATSYDIRINTSPITTNNWATSTTITGEPTPTAAGTQQTHTITGLAGSRTYYVAIRALDERGNLGALSNVVPGTTTDTVPPSAVRDLSYRQRVGFGHEAVLALVDRRGRMHVS